MSKDELGDFLSKFRESIEMCVSLSQLLIVLEHYIIALEERGLKQPDVEEVLKSIDVVSKQIMKLSSCRIDLVDRVLRRDPRIKRLNNYMHTIMEILQRECGQQTSLPPTPPPSQRVTPSLVGPTKLCAGRYEVVKIIGEGGMGIVWLAKDLSTNKQVAIKTPKYTGNPAKDELNVKKIIVEAEVLKNLEHTHIVKLIDFFIENQKPYLVMEYVEGDHLEKKVKSPNDVPSEKDVIEFMKNLTDAVDYMHSKNIVHRDLKPKNIFTQGDKLSNIKVIDFGTAKYYHSQIEYGEGIFSPGGYTAPEQLRFMYSPQSDIWSLGGILFYTLTGVHPITVLHGYPNVAEPPSVEQIKSFRDLNPNFIKVIKKAMDPDPVNRYIKASDLIKELQGESTLSEVTIKPKIIILGKEIEIDVDRIIIGRLTQTIMDATASKQRDKIATIPEGNNLYIYIDDPKSYISRLHIEIVRKGNEWYLRDLGSLNKTAVLEGGEWRIIHSSYKIPSSLVKLGSKSIISLGYDNKLGPYLVISFVSGSK